MKTKQKSALLFAWMCLYYIMFGFYFGLWNNAEELPLIYHHAGCAAFENDPFVQGHAHLWTAISPYVLFFSSLTRLFGCDALTYIYAGTHGIVLFAIGWQILSLLERWAPRLPMAWQWLTLLALPVMEQWLHPSPDSRQLIWNYLDPEFVALPSMIAMYVQWDKKSNFSYAIVLALTLLIHPLMGAQMGAVLVILQYWQGHQQGTSFKKSIRFIVLTFLLVLPYLGYLWWMARPTAASVPYNAALIHEIFAFPQHLRFPIYAEGAPFKHILFLLYVIVGLWVGQVQQRWREPQYMQVYIIVVGLYLLVGFTLMVRIDALIQSTPFRISNWVVLVVYLLAASGIWQRYERFRLTPNVGLPIWISIGLSLCVLGAGLLRNQQNSTFLLPKGLPSDRAALMAFAEANEGANSLWVNYTGYSLASNAKVSEYFCNNFGLTADRQVDWYKRALIYYQVPDSVSYTDYAAVFQYSRTSDKLIRFKAMKAKWPSSSRVFFMIFEDTPGFTFDVSGCKKVFSAGPYQVYTYD